MSCMDTCLSRELPGYRSGTAYGKGGVYWAGWALLELVSIFTGFGVQGAENVHCPARSSCIRMVDMGNNRM